MQYAPAKSSSVAPMLETACVQIVAAGQVQYESPSLVEPCSFAQRQDQNDGLGRGPVQALRLDRSRHRLPPIVVHGAAHPGACPVAL